MAFYPELKMISDSATTGFLSLFDRQLFAANSEEKLAELDIFVENFVLDEIVMQQATEFYKILIYI